MQALYRRHIQALITLGPVASFVLLRALANRGRASEAVPEDLTPRSVSQDFGIPARTVYRYWQGVLALFRRVPGGHEPRLGRPADRPDGREPWSLPIDPDGLRALLSLAREGRTAWPALRLALYLWPQLHGAANGGRSAITAPLGRTAAALSMSRHTVLSCLKLLAGRGLIQRHRGASTRLKSWGGFLGKTPRRANNQALRHNGTAQGDEYLCRSPLRGDRTHTRDAREAGPVSSPSAFALTLALVRQELGGHGAKAEEIARVAETPAGFLAWLDQEAQPLSTATTSPFGMFWTTYRLGGRPGLPSPMAEPRKFAPAANKFAPGNSHPTSDIEEGACTASSTRIIAELHKEQAEAAEMAAEATSWAGRAELAAIALRSGAGEEAARQLVDAVAETARAAELAFLAAEMACACAEDSGQGFELADQANLSAELAELAKVRARRLEAEHDPRAILAEAGRKARASQLAPQQVPSAGYFSRRLGRGRRKERDDQEGSQERDGPGPGGPRADSGRPGGERLPGPRVGPPGAEYPQR